MNRAPLFSRFCSILIVFVCISLSAPGFAASESEDNKLDPKYTWDLTVMFKSPKDWDEARKRLLKRIDELAGLKGSLDSAKGLKAGMDTYMAVIKDALMVHSYASLKKDEDLGNAEASERRQLVSVMWAKMNEATAWIEPEVLALGESQVLAFITEEPGLETYRHELDNMLRNAPYILSEEGEQLLSYFSTPSGAPRTIYDALAYADIEWPKVTLSDGNEVTLDNSGYDKWRRASVREDRKKVFDTYWSTWKAHRNSFGMILNAHIQYQVASAKARNYESVLQRELFADNLPTEVYTTLVEEVNKALPTLHRYFKLRARMLGIDQMHYYDIYPPLVSLDKTFDYETSNRITLDAMAILGDDWVSQQREGMNARWVHVYPSKGKRGGAYMLGAAYDAHPFLLLNHNDDYESLSTIAHEWGHAMHTLYAKAAQPFHKYGYATFIAEIPSTSLELILREYMTRQADSIDEKIFYLGTGLEAMRGTFFRQTMFAEFELWLYETVEKGEALTGEKMTQHYLELLKRYHGHDKGVVVIDDLYANEWMFIPHFYRNMYVFQYATSQTAGTALYQNILDDPETGVKKYKDLLRAGGSDYPFELLKKAGVDMTTRAPYKAIVKRMNETMDEIETLLDSKD
ncbi:MAG: oligoendopeptidase F [Gammaproteobacteria bacterium]|nr:oligoendopeptidase F [Gammaproteobacteria bacterium]